MRKGSNPRNISLTNTSKGEVIQYKYTVHLLTHYFMLIRVSFSWISHATTTIAYAKHLTEKQNSVASFGYPPCMQ